MYHPHELLCLFLREGIHVPHHMHNANIVTLCKNKGWCRSNCNNYHSNSILSLVGKVSAQALLECTFRVSHHEVYLESQCSFRAGRSTVDMIFSLYKLQDKCWRAACVILCDSLWHVESAFDAGLAEADSSSFCKTLASPHTLCNCDHIHSVRDIQSTLCFNVATLESHPYEQWSEAKLCPSTDSSSGYSSSCSFNTPSQTVLMASYLHTALLSHALSRTHSGALEFLIHEKHFHWWWQHWHCILKAGLQQLVANVCLIPVRSSVLTIILKKTNIMAQDAMSFH